MNKGVAFKTWLILLSHLKEKFKFPSLVSNLSIAFVSNDDMNLWANSSQEGGYDGRQSWKLHTFEKSLKTCHLQVDSYGLKGLYDKGPSMEIRRLDRSITKSLQRELEDQVLIIMSTWELSTLETQACHLLSVEDEGS